VLTIVYKQYRYFEGEQL